MRNNCYSSVTIGADPKIIQLFVDCEFSFKMLRPVPNTPAPEDYNEYWRKWCCENWGTSLDRDDYSLITRGKTGLNILFATAWVPPLELLKYLIEKYKIWIKCEWREEGGLAGVFIGQHNGERSVIREFVWDDWPLDEELERMKL